MEDRLDGAIGALLGLAVGDAVGTTLEFQPPGSFTPIDDMVGGGPFDLEPGQWTDDTSLALCLAESIVDTGGLDPVDQLRRYLLWLDEGYLSSTGRCFDIGTTTRTQLERFRRTGEPEDPAPNEHAASNGSLMRLAPVPIRWFESQREAAERSGWSSRTTHAAGLPVEACRALGSMIASLLQWGPFEDMWVPEDLDDRVWDIAHHTWRTKEPPAIRGTGFCLDALEAALWAVRDAEDFRSAVLRAANLGDDADTTAAIAGQLAGAYFGASGIPREWRDKIVLVERIEELARQLLVAGGGVDDPGWTHDRYLHAWWVEPGRLLAGEYPGHPDRRRAEAKVNLLVDAGVRTFVDLTTEHDGLEPYEPHVTDAARRRNLDLRRLSFPIPDLDVVEDHRYDEVLAMIAESAERGAVYVHCWGGVGRTGTVVACHLGATGLGFDAALDRLADLRAGTSKAHRRSPEMDVQFDLLRRRLGGR